MQVSTAGSSDRPLHLQGRAGRVVMLAPEKDLEDRKPLWAAMQMVWMDTDIKYEFENISLVGAKSKYSIEELELIYWNEVYPAVRSNLWIPIAPEWCGYELNWLANRIVKKNKFGANSLRSRFHFYSLGPWETLKVLILKKRREMKWKE